jgi:uncharacterized protein (DUF1697 family)
MARGRAHVYAALLRGINLGARNRIAMADLRDLFAGMGAEDVTTHLQSGNVVFRSTVGSASRLSGTIEGEIRSRFGLDVVVLLRTRAELGDVVAGNPLAGRGRETKHLHVTFLRDAPAPKRVRALEARDFGPDELRVLRREAYLRCPNGYGRSKLSNAYLERELGVAATTRNWKTVTTLAELAAG